MIETILWILALLLSVILSILATEPIFFLLARILGVWLPLKNRGIKGLWEATYLYESKGNIKSETHLMELRQFGNYVIGKNLCAQNHWHRLSGKIRNEYYYTGVWENTADGQIWHGGFQFHLHNDGSLMEGKWIGFDSSKKVQEGPWRWKLLSREIDKTTRQSYLSNWKVPDNLLKEWPEYLLPKELTTNKSLTSGSS